MAISITENYPRVSQNHLRFTIDVHGTPFTTTVTSDPEVVRKWLRTTLYRYARFRHRLVVGLGVQWRPASYRGEKPPVATLQLCVGRRCLIFQLRYSPTVPNLLRHFLKDPNHTFVGMWNHSDAEKLLESSEHELEMARKPESPRGVEARRAETPCQGVLYAAVDAYCSFLIGKDLRAWEFVNICTAIWTQEQDLWAQEAQEQDLWAQDLWAHEAQEQDMWAQDLWANEAQEQDLWAQDLWAHEAQEQDLWAQDLWAQEEDL
ncbi:hypothetical protein RHGRI_012758 [Rhododendron griersonianum]|uniref:3'-5' exonuclease domain-containing protein n=1 Tax=Rhododendron griersonianum TaxID=479676 RepID=A0AAV6KT30_9ERIC|nr:hypothetical protein RHGRI_012758 [Rhododendron griersonianum]